MLQLFGANRSSEVERPSDPLLAGESAAFEVRFTACLKYMNIEVNTSSTNACVCHILFVS